MKEIAFPGYQPTTGRFLTRDPLEQRSCCGCTGSCGTQSCSSFGSNPYVYADADPVNRGDPSGEAAIAVAAVNYRLVLLRVVQAGTLYYLARALAQEADCSAKLIHCLENPWQPDWNWDDFGRRKDCGACYRYCIHNGYWPTDKCPE
jgi:RHS repeat-associated protein